VKETWKKIPSLSDCYEASSLGRIRRAKPGRSTFVGRLCRIIDWTEGYKMVQVSVDGVWKYRLVHVLVAEAFHGPCPKGKETNHKDLDPGNNRSSNLEYLTHLENVRHCIRHGRFPLRFGEHSGRALLTDKKVMAIRLLYCRDKTIKSVAQLARELGYSYHLVNFVISGKTWKHLPLVKELVRG
jgi:hypothetical protein